MNSKLESFETTTNCHRRPYAEPETASNGIIMVDFKQKQAMSDIDALFAEFGDDPDFREGAKEMGSFLSSAYYNADEGETLRTLRLRQGLTQTELANKIAMKQSQLAKLENTASPDPKTSTLVKLSEGLGLPVEVILRAITNPKMRC